MCRPCSARPFDRPAERGAEKPFLFLLSLYRCHGDYADNIIRIAASGKIVDRHGKTLKDRTVGIGFGQSLYQLVTDVAGLKAREHQGVGMAGYLAAGCLQLSDRGNQSRIKLQFAVQSDVRILLLAGLDRFRNLGPIVVLRAALG